VNAGVECRAEGCCLPGARLGGGQAGAATACYHSGIHMVLHWLVLPSPTNGHHPNKQIYGLGENLPWDGFWKDRFLTSIRDPFLDY